METRDNESEDRKEIDTDRRRVPPSPGRNVGEELEDVHEHERDRAHLRYPQEEYRVVVHVAAKQKRYRQRDRERRKCARARVALHVVQTSFGVASRTRDRAGGSSNRGIDKVAARQITLV